MTVESWKELQCSQCGPESSVFMRGKDLADHKLEVHGPTREQLVWAVTYLHNALHSILSNQHIATTVSMYDEFASTRHYASGVAAVNHKVVQRVIQGD